MAYDENFIEHIQREQLHHKECRYKFVAQKLLFITALLGLGSIDLFRPNAADSAKFALLLYFVPFVAIAYDLFIFAENYKVKRIGAFLKQRCSGLRNDWEVWVNNYRENLAFYLGSFSLTMFSLLTSGALLFYARDVDKGANIAMNGISIFLWFSSAFVITSIIFCHGKRLEKQLEGTEQKYLCGLFGEKSIKEVAKSDESTGQ